MSISVYCKGEKDIENTSISSGINPRKALIQGHSLRVKCQGQSMYPMIKGGDTLLIEVVNANKLKPGDIAFYYLPSGTFVVHRLVKRNGSGLLLTNGDSLRQTDNPVTGEHVFGKVIGIEHGGKSLVLTGTLSKFTSWVIAFLARYRLPLQITLKRNLGRIHWFIGGRRIV